MICNLRIELFYNNSIKYRSKNNHYLTSLWQHIQLFTAFNIFGNNLNYNRFGTHKNT
jgi:hypothetical protein